METRETKEKGREARKQKKRAISSARGTSRKRRL